MADTGVKKYLLHVIINCRQDWQPFSVSIHIHTYYCWCCCCCSCYFFLLFFVVLYAMRGRKSVFLSTAIHSPQFKNLFVFTCLCFFFVFFCLILTWKILKEQLNEQKQSLLLINCFKTIFVLNVSHQLSWKKYQEERKSIVYC